MQAKYFKAAHDPVQIKLLSVASIYRPPPNKYHFSLITTVQPLVRRRFLEQFQAKHASILVKSNDELGTCSRRVVLASHE